jgi:hypothetical protein
MKLLKQLQNSKKLVNQMKDKNKREKVYIDQKLLLMMVKELKDLKEVVEEDEEVEVEEVDIKREIIRMMKALLKFVKEENKEVEEEEETIEVIIVEEEEIEVEIEVDMKKEKEVDTKEITIAEADPREINLSKTQEFNSQHKIEESEYKKL